MWRRWIDRPTKGYFREQTIAGSKMWGRDSPYSGNSLWGHMPTRWDPSYRGLMDRRYESGWGGPDRVPDFRNTEPEYISIVGSRELSDRSPVWSWMSQNIEREKHVVVTGDARGVDSHVFDYCRANGVVCVVVPADHLWDHYGRGAGMVRNPVVVRLSSNFVVAFPYQRSPGTYDAVRFADQIGKKLRFPLGGGTTQPDIFEAL